MPTAIVIGASSGIGREIAMQLCARGFRVGIAARNREALAEMSRSLGVERCVFQVFDVAQTDAALDGFRRLHEELSAVDYVYLVAGTGFPNPDLDWPLEEVTVSVNCLGFAALAAASIRVFRTQGRGHLVAITSVAAAKPSGYAPAYGASKAFGSVYIEALRHWTRQNKLPIHLTEIRPGFVDTAMMKTNKAFWVISPQKAATGIVAAVDRRAKIAYVPSRWRWVVFLLRFLPDFLYAKIA
jgi:short-subunit dehydrogenase